MLYMFMVVPRTHRDFRRRIELEEELRYERDRFERQSQIDGLTGLANRRQFTEGLQQRIALKGDPATGLLILDIDHFKHINDTPGHAAGDTCLVAIAGRLRGLFARPGEVRARLGARNSGSSSMERRMRRIGRSSSTAGWKANRSSLTIRLAR